MQVAEEVVTVVQLGKNGVGMHILVMEKIATGVRVMELSVRQFIEI